MKKEGIRGLDDAIFTGSAVNKEPLDQTVGLSIPFGFWTPQQQCCTQAPLIVLKCCVGRAPGDAWPGLGRGVMFSCETKIKISECGLTGEQRRERTK